MKSFVAGGALVAVVTANGVTAKRRAGQSADTILVNGQGDPR